MNKSVGFSQSFVRSSIQASKQMKKLHLIGLRLIAFVLAANAASAQKIDVAEEFARLNGIVQRQQTQIDELRTLVAEQQRLIRHLAGSETQVLPAATTVEPKPVIQSKNSTARRPLNIPIGDSSLTPYGFMDFSAVIRNKNVGSGLGTNFAGIPLAGSINAHLRDYRLSAQNSRVGLRFDSAFRGWNLLALAESDFLGFVPGNAAVSSNSSSMRLRLYWADLRRDKWEFLAGQSWSLLTPNRRGVSPLPGDLFLTQDVDPNIQVGLTWSRDPQVRLTYHFTNQLAAAFSWAAAEQYGGGSGGSDAIILPSALESAYGSQLNTGNSAYNIANARQDLVAKIAWDTTVAGRSLHLETAGILRRFGFYNPLSTRSFRATGGGGSLNVGFDIVKPLRVFANHYVSNGGGRYIFGQGPDLIIRGDGSPSLVHAYSTVDGLEYQATPKTLIFGYYGGAYFARNVAGDPSTGKPIGYGFDGAPTGHNRSIQEFSAGVSHTFWRNPSYGSLQMNLQYAAIVRNLWYVAPEEPGKTRLGMFYLNFRYVLPGAPPEKAPE